VSSTCCVPLRQRAVGRGGGPGALPGVASIASQNARGISIRFQNTSSWFKNAERDTRDLTVHRTVNSTGDEPVQYGISA